MNIGLIANGEAGSSCRTKLNSAITAVNETVFDVFTLHFTGTLPPNFPSVIEVDCAGGWAALMGTPGNIPVTPFGGVCTPTSISFSDSAGGCTSLTFDNLAGVMGQSSFSPINMTGLTSLSLPILAYLGGTFSPSQWPSLTTLSIPVLAYAGTFAPTGMNSLTTLSAPELVYTGTGGFSPNNMDALTTFNFPLLRSVQGNFSPGGMGSLTTVSMPSLIYVAGNFSPAGMASLTTFNFLNLASISGNCTPGSMASLTSLAFASLAYVGGSFAPTTMGSVQSVSCPALTYVGGSSSIVSMASLTTVFFSAMIQWWGTITMNTGLGNLANVMLGTVGTLKLINGATINISGQKLTAASVNAILALLVSLDGTNGTTLWGAGKTLNVSGGTSSAPTGQGIVDKATLIARGATVTTN